MVRFPPRRLLVTVDLSETSLRAWLHARDWANRFGAELETVHVVEPPAAFPDPALLPPLPSRRLLAGLRRAALAGIRAKLGDAAKVRVLEGDPVVTVLRLARTRRPDLIVMGTHGRTGVRRLLLGSVTEAVVRRSPVPVLAIRAAPRPARSVLAPVNFAPWSEAAFRQAAEAAVAFGARLTVLHVQSDPRSGPNPRFLLSELVRKLPPKLRELCGPDLVIETGAADERILAASRRHDLVVLSGHVKSLKELVLGTTAERVLRRSRAPVLIVPASARVARRERNETDVAAAARAAG